MLTIKQALKGLSVFLPSRRCELLLYEILEVLDRNAVRTNQIILSQRVPDFVFELTSAPKMTNGRVAKIYAPDAGDDYIQTIIATRHDFFSSHALERTRKWIEPGSHIIDIGGHIGNHAVYWAGILNAAKIYSFEPVTSTYAILERNITINQLEQIVQTFPLAIGEKPCLGRVSIPDIHNSGSVQILEDSRGECAIESLDSLMQAGTFCASPSIALVKIDVEGYEAGVLLGGKEFFAHYKPQILVEVFKKNKHIVFPIMDSLGYQLTEQPEEHDYLFTIKD